MPCRGEEKSFVTFVKTVVSFVVKYNSLNHKACLAVASQTGITK